MDLTPHQVEAASFAFKSPLSKGAILADEVGLGKTIEAGIALSSAAMTFTLPSIPAYVTNIKLVIQASEPQGNGITRAYSKAAAFASPYTPVTTAIDIKSAYDSKNGAPKVFFKYFYVNTATGEKSGEKMASAVLSA